MCAPNLSPATLDTVASSSSLLPLESAIASQTNQVNSLTSDANLWQSMYNYTLGFANDIRTLQTAIFQKTTLVLGCVYVPCPREVSLGLELAVSLGLELVLAVSLCTEGGNTAFYPQLLTGWPGDSRGGENARRLDCFYFYFCCLFDSYSYFCCMSDSYSLHKSCCYDT